MKYVVVSVVGRYGAEITKEFDTPKEAIEYFEHELEMNVKNIKVSNIGLYQQVHPKKINVTTWFALNDVNGKLFLDRKSHLSFFDTLDSIPEAKRYAFMFTEEQMAECKLFPTEVSKPSGLIPVE